MSHYTLDELIELWRREQLTTEQVIGQLLLVLKEQERRMREIARIAPSGESDTFTQRSRERS
jgi:hypothetical protein